MDKKYEEDKKLYKNGKPASKKLLFLSTVSNKLKNVSNFLHDQPYIWDKFLELGGL